MGLFRASIPAVLSFAVISAQATNFNQKKFYVNEPSFSSFFYSDSVGSPGCAELDRTLPFEMLKSQLEFRVPQIQGVVGYDWEKDHSENSNSLTVEHDAISIPTRRLFALSQAAVASQDEDLLRHAKRLVLDIAAADTLSNTMTVSEVRAKGKRCYDGKGNTKAECNFHSPQFAMQFTGNYMVSATLLWPYLSESERDVVSNYSDRMYKSYVRPVFDSLREGKTQFSQMANGGIAVLAFAHLKDNSQLAQKTFKKIFQNINEVFMNDGYVKGNSFRGVRGFWYHTYGVNSALAVLHLAKQWKVAIPKEVYEKVTASATLINVGIANLLRFESRKSPTGKQQNASYNQKDARPHVHQMAIAINELSQSAVNVSLNTAQDLAYIRKSKKEHPSDFTIGFNPKCAVSDAES